MANTCIICLGQNGPLSDDEKVLKITDRGLATLKHACQERRDDVAERLLPILEQTDKNFQIHFHSKCRRDYTNSKNIASVNKRQSESQSGDGEPPKKSKRLSRETTSSFSWDDHCFICGEVEKRDKPLSKVNMRPLQVRERVLNAAVARSDETVIQRLLFVEDIFSKNARYHRVCYKLYSNERNIEAHKRKTASNIESSNHEKAAIEVYDTFKATLDAGSLVLLPEICKRYKEILISYGVDPAVASQTRSFFVKEKLNSLYSEVISFHSQKGMPDVVCSNLISVGQMMAKVQDILKSGQCIQYENWCETDDSEDKILHNAVGILRNDIDKIPATTEYPSYNGVDFNASEAFVPESLKKMLQWLFDKSAYNSADPDYESPVDVMRKSVTLAECLIYCTRRGKNQVIPPFHVGFMAQMQHDYGSRTLVETLNSYGMCGNYDELRMFQTAIAEDQITRAEDGVYVPPEIIPKRDGGSLIQEGDDNVDINVETVDGKNTYHSMARVVFQQQPVGSSLEGTKLKRSTRRSLQCADANIMKTLPFRKPQKRPEPNRISDARQKVDLELNKMTPFCSPKELTWALLRQVPRGILPAPEGFQGSLTQVIPFWTGYNSKIAGCDDSPTVTVAAYPPIIEAPPSDMSTVYTTLKRGKDLAKKSGQDFHIHTFDQQLYAIAQMVKFSNSEEFPDLVVRLGGFHNLCTFIACIGKIWGDAGLKDMLADSETYAPATVERMLEGKQFHRAVRGLSLTFEALVQMFVTNYFKWVNDHEQQVSVNVNTAMQRIFETQRAFTDNDEVTPEDIDSLTLVIEQTLRPSLEEFLAWGCKQSVTFEFWVNFITAVQIMLSNIRAEREGDWKMHLCTQVNMLPYFFVADRPNYSRWGTLYALEMMTSLPEEVATAFAEGQFTVKQTPGSFKGIWSDMGVETSIIRDSKSDSGIIGLTRRGSAVLRWSCSRHILGRYAEQMQRRSGLKTDTTKCHEQTMPAMMTRDEEHLQQIVRHIENNMVDPFSVDSHEKLLLNVGSGLLATPEISADLVKAVDKGNEMLTAFCSRLDADGEDNVRKSFYQPIAKSGLKTFKDMKKTSKVLVGGTIKRVNVSPEQVYQRALRLSKVRPEVNLATVLSYPMTAVPSSIFKEDGSRRKTNKADLLHGLEDTVKKSVGELPPNTADVSVHVIDGMAFLRSIRVEDMKNFSDIGEACINKIGQLFRVSSEVHFIFDRYDDQTSPKNEEQQNRQGSGSIRRFQVASERPIPDWKAFMGVSENKAQLTAYLSGYIEKNLPLRAILSKPEQALYLGGGYESRQVTKRITAESIADVRELSSSQTEADTRMILHAVNANSRISSGRLIVQTPDTDVLVLLVYYFEKMDAFKECWMETGSSTKTLDLRRYIPVHEIAVALGSALCEALPCIHALTGCDTVSSFFGIGKKTALNSAQALAKSDPLRLKAIGNATVDTSRYFAVALYDPKCKFKGSHESLNKLRYNLAAKRNVPIAKLPPSEPSFEQHILRASWQTKTWTSAHDPNPEIPAPAGHGWILQEKSLVPAYFEGPTALEKLQDFYCNCLGAKCSDEEKCSCCADGVTCSEVCRCEAGEQCKNPIKSDDDLDEPDETSD